jgi:hypothetical protein
VLDGYRPTTEKNRRTFCSENLPGTALRAAFKVQGSKVQCSSWRENPLGHLEELNDCERNRISEQTAKTRLPVALLVHAGFFITFPEFRKRGADGALAGAAAVLPQPSSTLNARQT